MPSDAGGGLGGRGTTLHTWHWDDLGSRAKTITFTTGDDGSVTISTRTCTELPDTNSKSGAGVAACAGGAVNDFTARHAA
jgi:hypothetical protein